MFVADCYKSNSNENVTPLLCDSVTNITEGDISSIRVPELARALIAIIKRACEFDYCLNRTIGCDINVLCTCRKRRPVVYCINY